MKKPDSLISGNRLLTVSVFLILNCVLSGQDAPKLSSTLPESINKIVSVSCMPCHSSTGGAMSKSKLNFNEWTTYTPEKQKERAQAMYKELKKSEMPPKDARENNPDIIPTKEQIGIIKEWAKSFDD